MNEELSSDGCYSPPYCTLSSTLQMMSGASGLLKAINGVNHRRECGPGRIEDAHEAAETVRTRMWGARKGQGLRTASERAAPAAGTPLDRHHPCGKQRRPLGKLRCKGGEPGPSSLDLPSETKK